MCLAIRSNSQSGAEAVTWGIASNSIFDVVYILRYCLSFYHGDVVRIVAVVAFLRWIQKVNRDPKRIIFNV